MKGRLRAFLLGALAIVAVPAAAHPSYGIVVDAQDRVTFSDLVTVWRIEPNRRLRILRPGGDWHIHELAIGAGGTVYGEQATYDPADQSYRAGLWKIAPDGGFAWLLRPTTRPPKGLSLWRDREGATYSSHWTNTTDRTLLLFRRSREGRVTMLQGEPRAAAQARQVLLSNIGGTTVAPDGAVWLTNGPQLWRATPGGPARRFAWRDPGAGRAPSLRGIALERAGRIVAADMERRRVLRILPDGRTSVIHRSAPGWLPTGIALSSTGILVLEAGIHAGPEEGAVRVLRLRDGRAPETLARVPAKR